MSCPPLNQHYLPSGLGFSDFEATLSVKSLRLSYFFAFSMRLAGAWFALSWQFRSSDFVSEVVISLGTVAMGFIIDCLLLTAGQKIFASDSNANPVDIEVGLSPYIFVRSCTICG